LIDRIRSHRGSRAALLEPGRDLALGYAELIDRVDDAAGRLQAAVGGRGLVFLAMEPRVDAVVLYLACLAARMPVALLESRPGPLERTAGVYAPEALLLPRDLDAPSGFGSGVPFPGTQYSLWRREPREPGEGGALHEDLALLLTTSGSTGSPKLVRLSMRNLESNAIAIGEYLGLGSEERAIQSLPPHYSYGLSVLHSHLVAGGSLVLTADSFLRREFWSMVDGQRCTSFAGVPYMYETLQRLRFDPARHPSLRTMTQAGGALRPDLISAFHERCAAAGARFFVMYGQTEATARIAYVPPARLGEKIGAIGIAIPGGALSLAPVEGMPGTEELVYSGPNVMMGYAEARQDLALGDVQKGILRTGDLGRVDADGYFSVAGRLARFAKLFGSRISLEDVEREMEASFPVRTAALDGGDRIVLYVEPAGTLAAEVLAAHAAHFLSVPPGSIDVRIAASLPLTASGKKNYRALEALARSG
jgi:acyl-CoA synthetase (AMP-forming)/AMP-acid ligase II